MGKGGSVGRCVEFPRRWRQKETEAISLIGGGGSTDLQKTSVSMLCFLKESLSPSLGGKEIIYTFTLCSTVPLQQYLLDVRRSRMEKKIDAATEFCSSRRNVSSKIMGGVREKIHAICQQWGSKRGGSISSDELMQASSRAISSLLACVAWGNPQFVTEEEEGGVTTSQVQIHEMPDCLRASISLLLISSGRGL